MIDWEQGMRKMKHRIWVTLAAIFVAGLSFDVCAQDDPALPNVLIIGDSISMGYTVEVRNRLQDQANVYRPPANCQHTAYGLANIKKWLGDRKWDVIHFNWGIWDTHYLHDGKLVRGKDEAKVGPDAIRHTPEKYVENLKKLLATLESTDAELIWATTTPVMSRKGKRLDDIPRFNKAAAELMKERGIEINDLHSFVLPHVQDWQGKDQCHFQPLGNKNLGRKVAESILSTLENGVQPRVPAMSTVK